LRISDWGLNGDGKRQTAMTKNERRHRAPSHLLSPVKQKFIVHARETAVYRPFGSEPA
jgi:hypothetical protein